MCSRRDRLVDISVLVGIGEPETTTTVPERERHSQPSFQENLLLRSPLPSLCQLPASFGGQDGLGPNGHQR